MPRRRRLWITAGIAAAALAVVAVAVVAGRQNPTPAPSVAGAPAGTSGATAASPGTLPFTLTEEGTFNEAWAMAFLPSTSLALITERPGRLLLHDLTSGTSESVAGLPNVHVAGQGGLGDVILSAQFASDATIYLSWVAQAPDGTLGAVVGRATLDRAAPRLNDLAVIWRQHPTVDGTGHFSHRLALSPDGQYLFITSGERQKMTPAQDPDSDLGKIVRLRLSDLAAEHWSMGHRNPLGIAFAPDGTLWSSEMGPRGGDELNRVVRGGNYGWPNVSNGTHYDGTPIPDHSAGDGYLAPSQWWDPSISPGSLMIYRGAAFPGWSGDAFLGALSGQALVRVDLNGESAALADSWPMDARIRVVAEDPRDGTIWLIQDGPGGQLLHLTPAG